MTARLLCAFLACVASARATPSLYTVTDLGDLIGGSDYSQARDINNFGQVAGYAKAASGEHGFLWTPAVRNGTSGSMIDLGDLPGSLDNSQALAINNRGQITGVGTASTGARAFVWTPNVPNGTIGSMAALGVLPGSSSTSSGTAINDAGQVAGYSYCGTAPNQRNHAFLSQGSGGDMSDLGVLSPNDVAEAYSINSSSQVVGRSGSLATLWTPATPNGSEGTLVSLGDVAGGFESSTAAAINDAGQVAGTCNVSTSGGWRGAVWTPHTLNGSTGSWITIGDLAGGLAHSNALDINNLGQVVGYSTTEAGDHAVFWSLSEGLLDLNTLLDAGGAGWTLIKAQALNDHGQIVGYGTYDPDGTGPLAAVTHGFLLTPVPEPCTTGVLVAGLAMLSMRRRK